MKRDRLQECLGCQRMFIRRREVRFCESCRSDSMKFLTLVAMSLAVAFVLLAAVARLVSR